MNNLSSEQTKTVHFDEAFLFDLFCRFDLSNFQNLEWSLPVAPKFYAVKKKTDSWSLMQDHIWLA